jgi:hypothetical protein
MFKQYLLDSIALPFEVVDTRNYQIVATSTLNWQRYMRPMHDQQVYTESK